MSGNRSAERAQQQADFEERARKSRIQRGKVNIDNTFSEFDDSFYGNLREAQLGALLPDVGRQYNDAREQLIYALSRGGTLNSSVAGRRQGRLNEDRIRALTDADSVADDFVKNAKSDIENERSILVSQLQATADPELAAQGAASRADFLRVRNPTQTLGPLFQNATAGLGAALQPKYDANGVRIARSGGLFNRGGGSSRVVGG